MMNELQINESSTHCGDLERLAAAAATVGYSTDALTQEPQQIGEVHNQIQDNGNLLPTIVSNYTTHQFDHTRQPQFTTIRFAEYNPRTVYEQVTDNGLLNSSHMLPPDNNTGANRGGSQFTIIERPDAMLQSREEPFATSNMIPAKTLSFGQVVAPNIQYIDAKTLHSEVEDVRLGAEPSTSHHIQTRRIISTGATVIQSINSSETIPEQRHSVQPEKLKCKKIEADPPKTIPKKKIAPSSSGLQLNIPEPETIDGVQFYVCSLCKERFKKKYQLKRHFVIHTGEKRGSLSLETKVQIINRIKAGEKQVDLAMEYNVGRSTLSFIAKNASTFLEVIKDGKYNPENKRMWGAHRDDVENALYEWYKQATQLGMTVSGPILCEKARDFAGKLGYKDFKATHGWLDRFKHRKQVVLTRNKNPKDRDQNADSHEVKGNFSDQILPELLMDFPSDNIFYASEFGILHKTLPDKAHTLKGCRCAGGIHSKDRLTAIVCCNARGTEKFPLFVVSRTAELKAFEVVKSFPVHYASNPNSWITEVTFASWLADLDVWFSQQNRKVVIVLPSLPVHSKALKLNSIKLIVSPPSFVGPSKLGIVHMLKRNYRKAILQAFITRVEQDKLKNKRKKLRTNLDHDLLYYLHKLAAAWHSIDAETICSCFYRSGLSNCAPWSASQLPGADLGTENLQYFNTLRNWGLKIPEDFTFDDFISFDDDLQVCYLMDDDDIIASVKGNNQPSDSEEDSEQTPTQERDPKLDTQLIRNHMSTISNLVCGVPVSQEVLRTFADLEFVLLKS